MNETTAICFAPDSPLVSRVVPSPNFGERHLPIDMLLLHYTGLSTGEASVALLASPEAQVSAHYVVDEDGSIIQMVPEAARAWHAGHAVWAGESDINSRSIGIEVQNGGHGLGLPDFPEAQIQAVEALCADIIARHAIRADLVLGHSDVAPDRKQDPGEKFPWERLHKAGIGHWVEPVPLKERYSFELGSEDPPVAALQTMLGLYGYGIEVTGRYDAATEQVVTAFQRHFRPGQVDGVADLSTIITLRHLFTSSPGVERDEDPWA